MRDSDWVSAILQNAIPLIFILFTYLIEASEYIFKLE